MSDSRLTRAGDTGGATTKTFQPSDHDAVTKAARGVPDRTATTLAFDAGTRTFTITPVSGAWSYYIAGRRYIKSAAESIIIPDTSGPHWIYYDGATLSSAVNADHDVVDDLIVNKARIGIVYWNATDGVGHLVADERHGTEMSGATQEWFHDTTGAVWEDGLALSGYTLDTDSDAGVNFVVTDGLIRDEDLELSIVDGAPAAQYAQLLNSANAEVPIAYRDDVDGTWTQDAATTLPYKRFGAGRLAYNHDDLDGTWSQVEVTNNRFVLATLVATNDWQYPIKMVQGQAEYIDKKTAIEEANAEQVAWGTMITPEIVPLYRLVMETGDGLGGTNKCKIVAVFDLRRLSISGGLASPAEAHEILNGSTHPDTVTAAVTRGGLQIGNVTPAWDLLTIGAAGTYPRSDGSDLAYSSEVADHLADTTDPHGAAMSVSSYVLTPKIANLGNLTFDAYNASAHTAVYVLNSDATYKTDLYVDRNIIVGGDLIVSTGKVGIGLAGPQRDLHISSAVPTIRLSDSGAATDQAVATLIELYRGDSANRVGFWGMESFGNDIMALATDYPAGELSLNTGSNVKRLRISSSGAFDFQGNVMSGLTQLDVDNLRLDGNTLEVTAAVNLIIKPAVARSTLFQITGVAESIYPALSMDNDIWNAAMVDTGTSVVFRQAYNVGGDLDYAGKIVAGTETNWGAVAGTRDSYMAFHTNLDGNTTEKMRINSAGQVGIGTDDPCGRSSANLMLDVRREGDTLRAGIGLYTHENANANRGSTMFGARSRGTNATPVIVNNGDRLFAFVSQGFDGVVWRTSANIIFAVDGAPGAGAIPTSIGFWTGPGGGTTERFRIQSDGDILVDSGTSVFVRDSALGFNSSVDGQLDLFADNEVEITSATIELNAAVVYIPTANGIDYVPGADIDVDLITISVDGTPRHWWDESEDAFAMTHRLSLPEGVQTKFSTNDVADPPTDAELDAAFGDPTVVGSGFVGILDDNGAGLYCYICWTTGTAGEWFYLAGTKAV